MTEHAWKIGDRAHFAVTGYEFTVNHIQAEYLVDPIGLYFEKTLCSPLPPVTLPEGVRKVNARLPDGTPIVAGKDHTTRGGKKVFVAGVDQYMSMKNSSWPVTAIRDGINEYLTEEGSVHRGRKSPGDLISVWTEPEPDPVRHEWRNVYRDFTAFSETESLASKYTLPDILRREHWTVNTITGESTLIEVDGVPA